MATTQVLSESGIAYLPGRIEASGGRGHAEDFTDAYTIFVNGNIPTVFATSGEIFEKMFEFDNVDFSGAPLIVYKLGEKFVAWYDQESALGYVQIDACALGP